MKDGSITASFERLKGQGKVTYSAMQHTYTESRYVIDWPNPSLLLTPARAEIVKWVARGIRPFSIVEDPGFLMLMKTGRPTYRIPSQYTVAHDVHEVFSRVKERIGKMLRVREKLLY
jgi:hypothetical protein